MRRIALVFVLSLSFFSCEKDKQPIFENTDIPLIINVLSDGKTYLVYTYTDANLLSEEKSKFHYTKHTYNDRNLLLKSEFYMDPAMWSSSSFVIEEAMNREEWVSPDNTEKSLSQIFDYNNNEQLSRKTYIRPSVSDSEFLEFTWENDKIIRQTMYWKHEISGYIDFFYDEKGNLIKEVKYKVLSSGIRELTTTTEYEFDNMHNPYLAFKRLMTPGRYTNPNNIVKETYTIHFEVDPWIEKVQVTNYSYEYNHKEYPIRINGETEYVYK